MASAGSGKTRTLVHLICADLAKGVAPASIVAFTFTEKAAHELLSRTHALIKRHFPGLDPQGMFIGTIHSWCLQYLLSQPHFYGFSSIDELHTDSLVSRLYDYLGLQATYGQPYPRAINRFLKDVEIFYNENLPFKQVPSRIRPSLEKFLEALDHNRLLTFGGMVRHAQGHLSGNGSATGLASLYVDEYQDVNPAQVSLIKAMLPNGNRLTVVGDELQCIYNWRGSDVTRIINFSTEFSDSTIYTLATNYRARPGIIDFANQTAENIDVRVPNKEMKPGREPAAVQTIHWLSLEGEAVQAEAVATIVEKLGQAGVPWNRIAVLLRSVLGAGQPIAKALEAKKIPFQCPILSRGGKFIATFILPLVDWLRTEHKEPKNEIEEEEAERMADALWDSLRAWLPATTTEDVFWGAVNQWTEQLGAKSDQAYDVRGMLYDFLDSVGFCVRPDEPDLMVGIGIASQIIRSVEEIHRRRLRGVQRRTPRGIMSEIFFALNRKQQEFGESVPINTEENAVVLTTVHQSKGLEWPVVILPMLQQGRFPLGRRGHGTSFPDSVAKRYGTSLDDELRLFYVAATRAKERLFLIDPAKASGDPSVFLLSQSVVTPCDLSSIEPEVWHLPKEDLKEPDPIPLRIGLADLLMYIECPFQFGLRRLVDIQPSVGEELGYGMGLHELIQRRFESKVPWSFKTLKDQISANVRLPYMSEPREEEARKTIAESIVNMESFNAFSGEMQPEVDVEIAFDEGTVHGIIDGVQEGADKSFIVRDWKSSIHEKFLSRYAKQLQFYVYALQLQGKTVSKADIVDIAGSTKQAKLIAVDVNISPSVIEALVDEIRTALRGIVQGKFDPNPCTGSCGCCDVFRICPERISIAHGK
ncbi:MAG: ATP-dependent helicase [Chloroflexi bacterium]|nr:ATP-dependent helicase [Chloroflexota bacterium]